MNNQPNQDEELKKVIEESSLCHLCLSNVSEGEKEIEELISSIK